MAKRQTVAISIDAVENFIAKKGWSNSRFCKDIMGKGRGWISEWKRGANFPSPEEAAKMCAKFDCVPADIIVDVEDQNIVSDILEKKISPMSQYDTGDILNKKISLLSAAERMQIERKVDELLIKRLSEK